MKKHALTALCFLLSFGFAGAGILGIVGFIYSLTNNSLAMFTLGIFDMFIGWYGFRIFYWLAQKVRYNQSLEEYLIDKSKGKKPSVYTRRVLEEAGHVIKEHS